MGLRSQKINKMMLERRFLPHSKNGSKKVWVMSKEKITASIKTRLRVLQKNTSTWLRMLDIPQTIRWSLKPNLKLKQHVVSSLELLPLNLLPPMILYSGCSFMKTILSSCLESRVPQCFLLLFISYSSLSTLSLWNSVNYLTLVITLSIL